MGTHGPAWGQAALDYVRSNHCILTLHPTTTSPAPQQAGRDCPYFVSSSLSFSVSCLSSSFSPSFSFSFSFSSLSSWPLRGICCCCCKTRDVKQNNPSAPRRIHRSTWANLNKRLETMLGASGQEERALQAESTAGCLQRPWRLKAFRGDQREFGLLLQAVGQPQWLPRGQAVSREVRTSPCSPWMMTVTICNRDLQPVGFILLEHEGDGGIREASRLSNTNAAISSSSI